MSLDSQIDLCVERQNALFAELRDFPHMEPRLRRELVTAYLEVSDQEWGLRAQRFERDALPLQRWAIEESRLRGEPVPRRYS